MKYVDMLKTVLMLMVLWSALASAQPEVISKQHAIGKIVSGINLIGLVRTREYVVYRELHFKIGDVLDDNKLSTSMRRLSNLGLFHKVVDSYYLDRHGNVHITLELMESWTLIPVFKVANGGDTTYLVLGAYDVNIQGTLQEAGAQYESWDGENGGVVWYRNPRIFNKRIKFGIDIWSVKRPRHLYEPNGEDQGSFVLYQRKVNMFMDREMFSGLTIGAGITFEKDKFLEERMSNLLDSSVAEKLTNKSVMSTIWLKSYLQYNQLDNENNLFKGGVSKLDIDYTLQSIDVDNKSYRIDWDSKYFWRYGEDTNLGLRFRLAKTNSDELQHLYYIGGFENIRGYIDGQLRAKSFWQSNIEYRHSLYNIGWAYLQANIFADVAQLLTADSSLESQTNDIYSSIGVGLRIGSPRIYRLIARLDIALETSHPATSQVSFGVQQFF